MALPNYPSASIFLLHVYRGRAIPNVKISFPNSQLGRRSEAIQYNVLKKQQQIMDSCTWRDLKQHLEKEVEGKCCVNAFCQRFKQLEGKALFLFQKLHRVATSQLVWSQSHESFPIKDALVYISLCVLKQRMLGSAHPFNSDYISKRDKMLIN